MQIDKTKALQELEIPEAMFNELLHIFVEQTEMTLKVIGEAVNNKNYEEIRQNAHFIKGSAGNLRINGIQDIAKEIEFNARENRDIAVIKISIEKLKMAFEEVKKEVAGG